MSLTTDGLKPIESQNQVGFQKIVYNSSSNLNGNKLLYTYAKKNETATPYGNLFRSFNFPITNSEITDFNNLHANTALSYLGGNVQEIVVVEIPKGEYGELIDGKTFQLTLPVTLNSVATSTTVYGTYFGFDGFNGTNFLGNQLNKQFSEKKKNYFGFEPTADNDYNTNVTFLYCNDILPPKDKGDLITILTATTFTLTGNAANKYTFTTITLNTLDEVSIEITPALGVDVSNIKFEVNGFDIPINSSLKEITQPGITSFNPQIYQNVPANVAVIPKEITVTIKQLFRGNLQWNVWSATNRFPTVEADETKKQYSIYDGAYVNGQLSSHHDQPVGILFQDKGFAVITDPILVQSFRYSAGTSSGFNSIASGSPYNGDINFAKIYFTSTTISNAQFDSITTEFVQNILCLAGQNEFVSTTNATYLNAYADSATQKPTFITSIGLYNEAKELIGIAKLSEPIKKLPTNIVPFNIRLVI